MDREERRGEERRGEERRGEERRGEKRREEKRREEKRREEKRREEKRREETDQGKIRISDKLKTISFFKTVLFSFQTTKIILGAVDVAAKHPTDRLRPWRAFLYLFPFESPLPL
jgi:hypothetical protein